MRVGIVSDIQGYPYPGDWGMENLEKAFRVLSAAKINVLMMGGDLCDGGDSHKACAYYKKLMHKYFTPSLPVHVFCDGNHEYMVKDRKDRTDQVFFDDFCKELGESNDNPHVWRVQGYYFIAVNGDTCGPHSEKIYGGLREALVEAIRHAPDKPVFVLSHFQPFGTVTGSYDPHESSTTLRQILDEFPQAVSFSAHSHRPLEDERCIWQGNFTAVNTFSLSYGCTESVYVNLIGPILPFARESIGFMMMEIYSDHLDIHRFKVEEAQAIKPNHIWRVDLPYNPTQARYSDARKFARTAPVFAAGTRLLMRYDYGYIYLIFDKPQHDDFTHSYTVVIQEKLRDGSYGEGRRYPYIGDFYRLERTRDTRMVLKMPKNSLEAGKTYRFSVIPVETFGNEGAPLVGEYPIQPSYGFRNTNELYPQE